MWQGVSVESICSALRGLSFLQQLTRHHSLIILCDISSFDNSAIEVVLASFTKSRLFS